MWLSLPRYGMPGKLYMPDGRWRCKTGSKCGGMPAMLTKPSIGPGSGSMGGRRRLPIMPLGRERKEDGNTHKKK